MVELSLPGERNLPGSCPRLDSAARGFFFTPRLWGSGARLAHTICLSRAPVGKVLWEDYNTTPTDCQFSGRLGIKKVRILHRTGLCTYHAVLIHRIQHLLQYPACLDR